MDEEESTVVAAAEDLVRFFRGLDPAARREYDALAAADREFGEDVARERRGRRKGGGA